MGNISSKDMKTRERTVRLNDKYDDLLKALANMKGIPPAVLARSFIMEGLEHSLAASDSMVRQLLDGRS